MQQNLMVKVWTCSVFHCRHASSAYLQIAAYPSPKWFCLHSSTGFRYGIFTIARLCVTTITCVVGNSLKPWLQLRFNYDTITIRLRSDYDVSRARLLPFDAIRREQKMNMSIFRRSRVVVVSQSNRNCDIGFSNCELRTIFLFLS